MPGSLVRPAVGYSRQSGGYGSHDRALANTVAVFRALSTHCRLRLREIRVSRLLALQNLGRPDDH